VISGSRARTAAIAGAALVAASVLGYCGFREYGAGCTPQSWPS
jgi:hypothetical protein